MISLSPGFDDSPITEAGEQERAAFTYSTSEPNQTGSAGIWDDSEIFKNYFSFMSVLGTGGFGSVLKVKHRIDRQVYALKVIKLSRPTKATKDQMKHEVGSHLS